MPCEWFAVSSGAKIAMDSGTENMDWVAAALRRIVHFTQAGGEINVIVSGINVGAQPYFNAEATMLMHTRGILVMTPASAMVLTGKQALDYSGGVSAEDNFGIGGYERIMGPNGQAQYWAPDLAGACARDRHRPRQRAREAGPEPDEPLRARVGARLEAHLEAALPGTLAAVNARAWIDGEGVPATTAAARSARLGAVEALGARVPSVAQVSAWTPIEWALYGWQNNTADHPPEQRRQGVAVDRAVRGGRPRSTLKQSGSNLASGAAAPRPPRFWQRSKDGEAADSLTVFFWVDYNRPFCRPPRRLHRP